MLPIHAMSGSTNILLELANSAARAMLLAGCAGLVLIAFRIRSAATRLFTWSAVLYAALAMPMLSWMLPAVSVPGPSFSGQSFQQQKAGPSILRDSEFPAAISIKPSSETTLRSRTAVSAAVQRSRAWFIRWSATAAIIFFAVTLLLLARLLIGIVLGRRLITTAQTILESHLTHMVSFRAHSCGLRFIPRAAESELISVPVTMGVFRSTILLPAGWREWDEARLNAVIAHEMAHIARRDPLTQRISLVHRAIFWFSPLAWWLDRHLALLAEQASDDAALSCGVDRNDYARTLLGFFEALQSAPGRVWWQGVSMARGKAEHRVERILAWRGAVTMSLKSGLRKSIVVGIIAFAVPLVFLAASVRPDNSRRAAGQADQSSSSGSGYSYAFGNDDNERFVIVAGNSDTLTMSGSTEDAHHVEKLRRLIPGDFIWFQRDEKSYVIRDQALVDRARKFWLPQEELGKKQEALGKQQEALGKQQEAIGTKMQDVRVKVPDMTAELDRLKAKLRALGSTASMEQIGEVQSEIGELQSKIGEIQSQAGEQQGKVGEEMSALGEKQGKLGEQQGELGHQQAEAAQKALREMKQLFDEAMKSGKAQSEPESGGGASL